MVDERRILEEVDKTLHSLASDGVLDENPFLFTRIQAGREARLRNNKRRFVLMVRLKYVALLLLLLVNLATVIHYGRGSEQDLQDKLVSELKVDLQIDQSQRNF